MADQLTPQQELVVLRRYAQGTELAAISKELGCLHEETSRVVSAVGFQRGRAAELVRQREAALVGRRVNSATPPPAVVRAPAPKLAGASGSPRVDEILARAFEVGGTYAQRAERIRTMAVDLRNEIGELAAAERRVADLEAMLSDAKNKLRKLKRGTAATAVREPKEAA